MEKDTATNIIANSFKDKNMEKGPFWAKYMKEGDFISHLPSYKGGEYINLFSRNVFECEGYKDVKKIRYYLYDPTLNGYPKNKKYPLLIWFHGATNSLVNEVCITYSGAELYASEKYQKAMGGAYVLVPLANEKTDEQGRAKFNLNGGVVGGWSPVYFDPLVDLIESLMKNNPSMGKAFASGGSNGGYLAWNMLEHKPELFFAGLPISSSYIPSRKSLEELDKLGIQIVNAIGIHDEFNYKKITYDKTSKLFEGLKNIKLYMPEWVKNGDGGIASIFVGVEMGQHCLINQAQANLMFDDGKPYDKDLFPNGVTGFIKDSFNK